MKTIVKSTRKTADREIYSKLLLEFSEEFNKLKMQFVTQFNKLRELNEDVGEYSLQNELNRLDDLALCRAWIEDRLNNRIATTHHSSYRGSLTKKVRKALGYTL